MQQNIRKAAISKLQQSNICQGWKEFITSSRPGIIYGAGRQATVIYDLCSMLGKECHCLMTKDSHNRWGMLPREDKLPLYLISEMPEDIQRAEYDIIIAVNPMHNADIFQSLRTYAWPNIMYSDNWENDNATTREIFFRTYLEEKGTRFLKDGEGLTYIEYDGPHGLFKIYYDIDEIYKSALLGDINNIILPSIFDDYSLLSAFGPYEYGPVRLKDGDTAFDLGANIGMFSCVAASKGCHVHAFEPTPDTVRKYLRKNVSLYNTIEVVDKAVFRNNCDLDFYINNNFDESTNITRHSVHRYLEPNYKKISVCAITLDSYISENKISNIDFIKSHTEYSELSAIEGCPEILKKFSPKLAFLATSEAESIVKLILKANKNYVFQHCYHRLLGHIDNSE